jgi:hypothetical protein
MLFNDLVTDGEAETGAFAHGLGREKGVEDPVDQVVRDAGPGVRDRKPYPGRATREARLFRRIVRLGLDENAPSLGREIDGIQEQVHQQLSQAARVRADLRNLAVQIELEGVLEPRGPVLEQEQHFLDELVDVDLPEGAPRGPRTIA